MRRGTPKVALCLGMPEHEYNQLQRLIQDTNRTMIDLAIEESGFAARDRAYSH